MFGDKSLKKKKGVELRVKMKELALNKKIPLNTRDNEGRISVGRGTHLPGGP